MFTFLYHRKYSRLLQEFVSCMQGLNCEVNNPSLLINEMKEKALACGDTLPDLTGINTGSGNTNTGTGGNINEEGDNNTGSTTGTDLGTNAEALPRNRPSVNSCLKSANESIYTASTPEEKCRSARTFIGTSRSR